MTASPGGTYHTYGAGLARLLSRELGIPVGMRATGGPAENLQLIESGEAQLAFVTMGVALQGWNGMGAWAQGRQYRTARAMFPMYDTPFQLVVLKDWLSRPRPTWRESGSGSGRKAGRRPPMCRRCWPHSASRRSPR